MIVAGIGTGIAVWSIAAAVEQRASYQVFIFPDDAERVSTGRNLALATNLLWGFGSLIGMSGLGLALWDVYVPAPVEPAPAPAATTNPDDDDSWDAEVTHISENVHDAQTDANSGEADAAVQKDSNSDEGSLDPYLSDDDLPDGELPEGDL